MSVALPALSHVAHNSRRLQASISRKDHHQSSSRGKVPESITYTISIDESHCTFFWPSYECSYRRERPKSAEPTGYMHYLPERYCSRRRVRKANLTFVCGSSLESREQLILLKLEMVVRKKVEETRLRLDSSSGRQLRKEVMT